MVDTITNHKRIIFNGNNYAEEWKKEAQERGLLNLPSTPDALPYLITDENVALFERQRVYTRQELHSRYDVQLENYCKVISIEAHTMLDIVNKEIIPAISAYSGNVARDGADKRRLLPDVEPVYEQKLLRRLTGLINEIGAHNEALQKAIQALDDLPADPLAQARHCRDCVFKRMQELRALADEAESIVDEKLWPFPGYGELLTTK